MKWLAMGSCAFLLWCSGCTEKEKGAGSQVTAGSPARSADGIAGESERLTEPLLLPLADALKTVAFGSPEGEDSPEQLKQPWGNYVQSDGLVEALRKEGRLPTPRNPPGWERYSQSPVEAMVGDGRILFPVVHRLYREGLIDRGAEGRVRLVAAIAAEVARRGGDATAKVNAFLALVHIGFEEEALAQVEAFRKEAWFEGSWDANFFAGTLLFRHRRYAEAAELLSRAHQIQPEKWSRLWLQLALDASKQPPENPLFVFGDHMGALANKMEGAAWPFRDRAAEWGLIRWQLAGALAFGDYDNDTWVDFVGTGVHASPDLYRNRPGRGFVHESVEAFADTGNVPPGCVAADFDNDGFTDLYMTRAAWFGNGPNRLFRNVDGKTFVDQSMSSGAALLGQNSCGATALDFDRDGRVDLAVSGTSGGTLRLLRNLGDMKFEEVTSAVGILPTETVAVSVSAGDLNNDGWPDLFVNTRSSLPSEVQANGNGPNQLYLNDGKGKFSEVAKERGVDWGTSQGFGSWFFDVDNDGDLDILAANFTDEDFVTVLEGFEKPRPWKDYYHGSALYVNDGRGFFENEGKRAGFVPASVMGAQLVDFNLDGFQDVILGPGSHPLKNMQPLLVYRNNGDRTFTNVAPTNDATLFGKFHGIATSDVDHDGDPDLVVNNGGVLLSDRWQDLALENLTEGMSWLHFRLKGTRSNAGGIGARITVSAGEQTWTQEVRAGQGFASTNGPYLIFGLGKVTHVDDVTIRWPSGHEQRLPPLAVNQALEITEEDSTLRRHY